MVCGRWFDSFGNMESSSLGKCDKSSSGPRGTYEADDEDDEDEAESEEACEDTDILSKSASS